MGYKDILNKQTRRDIAGGEIRALEENNEHVIIGTIPYNRDSSPFLGFTEVITPRAFERTLQERAEVKALVNHSARALIGSRGNGTLTLESGETGLTCRCVLPKTSYAEDLYEVVKRGDVKTMSFGFIPRKYRDDNERCYLEDGDLYEVSFGVPFPAYEETDTIIERRLPMAKVGKLVKREIDMEKLAEIVNKEELTEAEIEQVKELISLLEKKVGVEKEKEEGEESPPPAAQEASWRSIAERYGFGANAEEKDEKEGKE
jgi:HK97 family phage prohead protease